MSLRDRAFKMSRRFIQYGLDPVLMMCVALLLLFFVARAYDPQAVQSFFLGVIASSPLWLPFFLAVIFWIEWITYIRYKFFFSWDYVLLEVQLPQEVEKSPLAMETFLIGLWNGGGETTLLHRIWRGSHRPIWSLEIASNEGRISFYMHMRKSWRNIVEARLYGQFPEAKVFEVDDYAAKIPFDLAEYDYHGSEYEKGNIGALPIKTYIDYKLDKNEDQEYRVDPLTNVLELLGQVGKNEYYWLQIIIKARKADEWYGFYLKTNRFMDEAKKEIARIMQSAATRARDLTRNEQAKDQAEARGLTLLTGGEKLRVEAIERSMAKNVFECGIRTIYLAKKDNFNGVNVGAMVRFFDSFRATDTAREYNAIWVTRLGMNYNHVWQDFRNIRKNIEKKIALRHYKQRAYFYVPYDQEPIFLTTEELATLWHFPSSIVQTPGLNRVAARRSEAPPNLPTLPT